MRSMRVRRDMDQSFHGDRESIASTSESIVVRWAGVQCQGAVCPTLCESARCIHALHANMACISLRHLSFLVFV